MVSITPYTCWNEKRFPFQWGSFDKVRATARYLFLGCLLFLLPVPPLQADSPPLLLAAGSRFPVKTVLEQFEYLNSPKLIMAEDIHADLAVHETMHLTFDQLIDQILPSNGFFTYRSGENGAVVLSRDLVKRHFPLSREVNRGLRRAVAAILGSTDAATFSQALERVLWGRDRSLDLVVDWPERSLRLTTQPSELVVFDTRSRIRKVQEYLKYLGDQAAKTPPVALEIEALPLEQTTGSPFISKLDEDLYGGTGFDGNSWDGTPFLALDEKKQVLVIGHTRSGIQRAREIAGLPPFKVPVPALQLASRSYQTVPDKVRGDLSVSAGYQREQRVVAVTRLLESMLYGSGGREEAESRGRVILPHPEDGTIDVIDTPENLQKIEDYLQYQGVSAARHVASYSRPTLPQIRVIQVQHRAIDQAARALGARW